MAVRSEPASPAAEAVTRPEPASFRDPANQVYYADGQVLRGLRGAAVDDWRALSTSVFFAQLSSAGAVVGTEQVEAAAAPAGFDLTLRHERIPFVSYPYEWTFSMLRDAARCHLDVLAAALAEGFTTKDGSAYNLQWRGPRPTFIDIGSFERLREGEPWAGYRQFCQTMLYPLLLTAHLGVEFQPWLRSQIDGIEPAQIRQLLGGGKRFKAGVFKHVHLHNAVQARSAKTSAQDMRQEMRAAGFSTELVKATVRGLQKLVDKLAWEPPASHWGDYRTTCTYSDADREAKLAFVDAALAEAGEQELVVDLGANDGAYSRVAAKHAAQVVAVESDHAVTDRLYEQLRGETGPAERILPLVMDLANPSPGGGWRNRERAAFADRSNADTVLALAVVHHLAIGRNVPLPEVRDLLAELGKRVVVEFVDPADPMAQQLLANKPAGMFPDYHREGFERLLAERFEIIRREELPSGTRVLYTGVPRD
ncbi:methyltransferase [Natronosporangium hydrolyticum]|uniref:Methyltransferase n=1 Tax=Natronosporangium hydrolyticum TaxID=2811111 RepID=A0A895YHC1_9ACTN|nr:methyltransferase [Natronosporangium hydrolyticum]QSB13916.1 methyltransferase [Natronosporangium hydrolyticum]